MRSSQEKRPDPAESQKTEPTEDSGKKYPFYGYDVGDELVHISGETSYLFPRDGSLIKIESYDYIDGNKANRTTVYKDDNMLILNVKNPTVNFDEPVKAIETIEVNVDLDTGNAQPLNNLIHCPTIFFVYVFAIESWCCMNFLLSLFLSMHI